MFISRFNRFFEKHGRWMYLILGVIISASFVWFMTPGRSAARSGRAVKFEDVGRMYGKKIGREEFIRKVHQTDVASFLKGRGFLSQNDRQGDRLIKETLKRIRAIREAKNRGLDAVSHEELVDSVRDMWMFQENGKFVQDRFSNFKKNVLAQRGLDGEDFDEILKENILVDRLEEQVTADVFVSDAEVRELYDQYTEKFVVHTTEFRAANVSGVNGDPSDDEITAYFDANRDTIRLSDKKRVRVAVVDSKPFLKDITVTDAEILTRYNALKKTAYKSKTLDQVRGQIKVSLQNSKAMETSRSIATEFLKKVSERPEEDTPEALAARFLELAKEDGVETVDSGPFAEEGEIPELGKVPGLQRQAYALDAEKPLSQVIHGVGKNYVACWLETVPGAVASELDAVVRKQVIEALDKQGARELYKEKVVGQFGEALKSVAAAWDLIKDYEVVLAGMADKDSEEKQQLRTEYRSNVQNYAVPYFVPEQKKARVAVFSPAALKAGIVIKDDDVVQYYNENEDEYNKKEVRLRQISVKFAADAKDEVKKAKRGKIEGILQRLHEGETFADLAKTESEDAASKANGGDIGYKAEGTLAKQIDEVAFGMDIGEISDIIETPTSYVLIKLESLRPGKPLAEVAGEIRKKLIDEEAERLAMDAAYRFADAVFEANESPADGESPADVFKRVADEKNVKTRDTAFFRDGGSISPFGYDRQLSQSAFQTSKENPFAEPVKGKTDVYVACWLESKKAYLPELGDDENLMRRVVLRVRRERAIARERERAQETWQKIQDAIGSGKDFAAASEGVTFKESEPFTRTQPPSELRSSGDVQSLLSEAAPETLLEPVETENGALLVYVASRTLASDEDFQKERDRYRMQLQWSKRQAALDSFYERLEEESETTLTAAWGGEKAE